MNKTKKNKSKYIYIFGYGSLTHDEDRKETTTNHYPATPVIINKSFNHTRSYLTLNDNEYLPIRAMGLTKSKGNLITGSIFKIPPSVSKRLNQRERHYKKIRIPWKHVSIYNNDKINKSIPLYTYEANPSHIRLKNIKPWEYYLDLTIMGHLQYGVDFTKLFFKSCKNLPESHSSYEKWLKSNTVFSYHKDKWNI